MTQDSSLRSETTEGSSAGRQQETTKQQPLCADMSGNFFVIKQQIDVQTYHKWLVEEQPKPEEFATVLVKRPVFVKDTIFLTKE